MYVCMHARVYVICVRNSKSGLRAGTLSRLRYVYVCKYVCMYVCTGICNMCTKLKVRPTHKEAFEAQVRVCMYVCMHVYM
jgi:hypothetical protein